MTQEQLAAKVGVKHSTIGRLERGASAYTQDTIEKLADALDCSPSELLFVNPNDPGAYLRDLLKSEHMRREFGMMVAEAATKWMP